MQGKYKCKKGLKKVKIKKYEGGVKDLLTDDEGNLTDGAVGAGSAVSGLAATGLEALTKSKYADKYTSQLKDSNQATGRAIGAGAGQALNLVAPGLGTIATPLLSSAGEAIQRGFQGNKLEKIKKEVDAKEKMDAGLATMDGAMRADLTQFQAKQYSKGSKKLKAPSGSIPSESTNTDSMSKAFIPSKKQEENTQFNKFVARNGTIKPAESDGIKTARKVLRTVDNAATVGQAGNFIPHPAAQAVGKISSAVGVATGLAQAGLDTYSGDYGSAAMNAGGALLSGAVGKLGGKTVSKVGGQLTGLDGITEGAKRVKYTSLAKNPHIGAAFAGEASLNQYSKGTKVIEIEGKKTPEIHTDKNFKLKNLGATPHSKGGTKVVAEEGDVVFPTQNSPEKYNEVMTAIMKKDKYKLKKEQNKLPEDKASKYAGGGTVDRFENIRKNSPKSKKAIESGAEAIGTGIGAVGSGLSFTGSNLLKNSVGGQYNPFIGGGSLQQAMTNPSNSLAPPSPVSTYAPLKEKRLNDGGWLPGGIGAPEAKTTKVKGNKGSVKRTTWKNPNQAITPLETGRMTKSENTLSIPEKIAQTEVAKTEAPIAAQEQKQKKGLGIDGNNLMELAPIAYNLGQGLFGKAETVNRKQYTPELESYVDTSNNMRREVNQNYKMGRADARNLSAGSAGNFRANAQAAANQKLGQMNQIDSQEYGKQLDVSNRNVGITNDAKLKNIDLFNSYEDLDAQNRAVKQNALTTGLEQLGELGSRNKYQKNALSNQYASAKLLSNNYDTPIDENGQASGGVVFGGAKSNPINSSSLGMFAPRKPAKQSKGSKSIQVSRRYKLK